LIQEPQAWPSPAWDPAVRRRVQQSLTQLVETARDVARRHSDRNGFYAVPDLVGDIGDVTGLIATGYNQVVQRVQEQLDETRRVMREVYAEIDDHKRQRLDDAWRQVWREI
jgi:hypothetical protein